MAAVGQQSKDELSIVEWATVLYRAARFVERIGNISDAEVMATKAMEARKKVLGEEHEETLSSISMVGLVYRLGGRSVEAEKLEVQVVETRKTILGADHPDTLTSTANLASMYSNRGQWKESHNYEDFVTASTLREEERVGFNLSETLAGEGISEIDKAGLTDDDSLEAASVSSHITTPRERDGKAHLAHFLATDAELHVLCNNVIEKLGEGRFASEGRKILKRFYLGLLRDAKTELERQSTALLKSRSGRTRMIIEMANMITRIESENIEDSRGKMKADEQIRMRERRLEMWAGAYTHNIHSDKDSTQWNREAAHALEMDSALPWSDSEEDSDSKGEAREISLPIITEMEYFFRNSKSFKALLEGFRELLLPTSLKDILPASSVEISIEEDFSMSNRVKGFVEDFTMLDWDWWPLRPRMRALEAGERRLSWICLCGTRLWKEISVEEAEAIERILPTLNDVSLGMPQCSKASDEPIWKRLTGNLIYSLSTSSSGQNKATPSASGGTTTSTSAQTPSANQITVNSQSPEQTSKLPLASRQHNSVAHTGGSLLRWIIVGSQSYSGSAKLEHIAIDEFTNDSSFFRSLRNHYRKHRGFFKTWFSFWRVGACDSVRFDRVASNLVFLEHPELPTNFNEYIYSPKAPPTGEAKNPLISRHKASKFLSCDNPCRWRLFHICVPDLVNRRVIERVPRKKSVFEIDNDNSAEHEAWGLTIRLEVSARYVAFYHLFILVLPFSFWGWWQTTHPGDLQNASVPVTVVLGLLSLFWGTNGILTQGRQFSERTA